MSKKRLPKVFCGVKPSGLRFKIDKSAFNIFQGIAPVKMAHAEDEAEIPILGAIGEDFFGEGITAANIRKQLKAIGDSPVSVTLNSPGGDAIEGIAIYNLLREHPGNVNVNIVGMAASAGSIIAMAGDTVRMGEATKIMIHSAWAIVAGNQDDLTEMAEFLDSIDTSVAELYSARSNLNAEEVLELMREETWMGGQQSIDLGFADEATIGGEVVKAKSAKARIAATVSPGVLAATGKWAHSGARMSAVTLPGVTGSTIATKKGKAMTLSEQRAQLEAKRAANVARMDELMTVSAEAGRTLEENETEEYDALSADVDTIDAHLVRVSTHEAQALVNAKRLPAAKVGSTEQIVDDTGQPTASVRTGIVSVSSQLPKGIPFTRYVKALAMAKGSAIGAHAIAKANKHWHDTSPIVEQVLMAAVAGGDTTTSGWASEMVYNENLVAEFIEILRPQTILGRLPGLTNVPFNVRMSGADSGSSANWVGQGVPVPVSAMNTIEVTLGIAKAAGLVVLTEELVRSSQPSAELMVRNDLAATIAEFLDQQFVDPGFAAVANVSPASITNGVTATAPTGTNAAALRTDVQTLFNAWIQNNVNPLGGVWIMSPTIALAISLMRTTLDAPEFPGLTMQGGTFFGLPVTVSNSANIAGSPLSGDMLILVNAKDILLADDGQLTIDASKEASIEMLDNPTNNAAAGTPTTMVSMFQTNAIAIKAVRFINWAKKRTNAVEFIQDAAYRA